MHSSEPWWERIIFAGCQTIPFLLFFAGLVCVNSHLYAIGGYDGQNQLCTVESYNTVRNIWEPRASMQHCRSAHGVTVHQGRIYVLGQSHSDVKKNIMWGQQAMCS